MAMERKLKDPVADAVEAKQAREAEDGIVDINSLSESDFTPIPIAAARSSHPFDGYPVKAKVTMGTMGIKETFEVSATHVLALNPKEYVHQDQSGKGVTVIDTKTKTEKIVNIPTFHNRRIRDYERGGISTDVVFDRTVPLKDGRVMQNCAYVPNASVRAQLMFFFDPKLSRIQPDRRYVILDRDQTNRLRKYFEMISNPKIKVERLARAISGESEEAIEEIPE